MTTGLPPSSVTIFANSSGWAWSAMRPEGVRSTHEYSEAISHTVTRRTRGRGAVLTMRLPIRYAWCDGSDPGAFGDPQEAARHGDGGPVVDGRHVDEGARLPPAVVGGEPAADGVEAAVGAARLVDGGVPAVRGAGTRGAGDGRGDVGWLRRLLGSVDEAKGGAGRVGTVAVPCVALVYVLVHRDPFRWSCVRAVRSRYQSAG